VRLGFSANFDNAEIEPSKLGSFFDLLRAKLTWRAATRDEQSCSKGQPFSVFAVCTSLRDKTMVLRNDYVGFPDPAEFRCLSWDQRGRVIADGYFEEWPTNWTRPANNGG
jgi:hypothetical protein